MNFKINLFYKLLCSVVRTIQGSKKCPNFIYKLSRKIYGDEDRLARYWLYKYNGITIGEYTYGYQFLGDDRLKSVGKYCSIAPGTCCIAGNHDMSIVTTSPVIESPGFDSGEKNIVIGNDVWIGVNCIIFTNVTIGDGAVIAAGAIVRKDVPPYAVVAGVDRIIKYRFSQQIIDKLLKIQWWNWEHKKIKENEKYFLDTENFVKKFYLG